MLIEELIGKLPPGTEEAVKRAKDRFHQHIREALRHETRLSFRRTIEDTNLFGTVQTVETTNVRVRIEPGYPASLEEREPGPGQRLSAMLAPWRGTLQKLKEGTVQTRDMFDALSGDIETVPGYEEAGLLLEPMGQFADRLLAIANQFDFVRWILDVDEDVLGLYTIREERIDLYWGVIGLVAKMLAVAVEDLTIVVLAHELAHSFTHVGSDSNGHVWPTDPFMRSDRAVLEGLAQYYTYRVCQCLAGVAPFAKDAYAALLPHQPWPYHVHEPWIERNSPEEVRSALLQARRGEPVSLDRFESLLDRAHGALGTA
jgi:hypothetical protein